MSRLLNLLAVPPLGGGNSVTFPHGLHVQEVGQIPDLCTVIGATNLGVTGDPTDVTVSNPGPDPTPGCLLFVWHVHSLGRDLDGAPALPQQPLVIAQTGGGGGGGGGCDCPGAGPLSTRVGAGATAVAQRSTAVGNAAMTNADDTTALGWNAQATIPAATAVGASASAVGPGATALGEASVAGAAGVAVGNGASAAGPFATVVGQAAGGGDHTTVVGRGAFANGGALGGGVAIGESVGAAADQIRIGSALPGSLIDDFAAVGANGPIIQALSTTADILPGGGAVGLLVSVNRAGVVAVETVFCGPAGSGPGGVGRALYIAD